MDHQRDLTSTIWLSSNGAADRTRPWLNSWKGPFKGFMSILVEILSNLCGMTSRCSSTGLWERNKLATTEVEDSSLGLCACCAIHVGGTPRHPGALRGVQVPLLLLQVSWAGKVCCWGNILLAEAGRPLPTSPSVPHSACTESSSNLCHQQQTSLKWVLKRAKYHDLVLIFLFSILNTTW